MESADVASAAGRLRAALAGGSLGGESLAGGSLGGESLAGGSLGGESLAGEVAGFLLAAGGGLTGADLAVLTGAPVAEVESVLAGFSFGDAAGAAVRVAAAELPGAALARYRHRIRDWIDSFARLGWPDATPRYAVLGYPAALAEWGGADAVPALPAQSAQSALPAMSALPALSALARDPGRHAFLLRATGSDDAAVSEIRAAQRLVADQAEPDLRALVELAVYRNAMALRNQAIPAALPAVWARLGRLEHAEALARVIPDAEARAAALAEVAEVTAGAEALGGAELLAAGAGALGGAELLAAGAGALGGAGLGGAGLDGRSEDEARTLAGPEERAWAMARVAGEQARAGHQDRAEVLARAITDRDAQAWALTQLAEAALAAGNPDRAAQLAAEAEALARTVIVPYYQARALEELAMAIARTGDLEHAEALARVIADPGHQADTLAALADVAAKAGDANRASRLAAVAEALARMLENPFSQAGVLGQLASAAGPDGASRLISQAEALTFTSPQDQVRVRAWLAAAAAEAGDPDRAAQLMTDAEAAARTSPDHQAQLLVELATAAAEAGDTDRSARLAAEAEAGSALDPAVLAELADTAVQTGDLDRAEALARMISRPDRRARTFGWLATVAARAGDTDRASGWRPRPNARDVRRTPSRWSSWPR